MKNGGYSIEKNVIVLNRDLTKLDIFVRDFISVLSKYSDYLIVSGYVSISSGRARGTEDIDILIPIISELKFQDLFIDLTKNGYWCYQGDTPDVYDNLKNLNSIRFAIKDQLFPNIELVPFNHTKPMQEYEFSHPQKMRIKDFEFKIPPIEFEILYKEIILAGDKDKKDASHLRTFFSEILKEENFDEYRKIIK
jgi:hypothetical protein